jgi:hypothetical protein
MTNKILSVFFIIITIVSCQSEQEKLEQEVAEFENFSDSLLAVNKHYVEVLYGDTSLIELSDPLNPSFYFKDTAIQLHSNIFDTSTVYAQTKMAPTLQKYNSWEQKLDSLKTKMDKQTIDLFEHTKSKINEIKQPVK